jgi:hypothetical protein
MCAESGTTDCTVTRRKGGGSRRDRTGSPLVSDSAMARESDPAHHPVDHGGVTEHFEVA